LPTIPENDESTKGAVVKAVTEIAPLVGIVLTCTTR
jgi:hypothetical protein